MAAPVVSKKYDDEENEDVDEAGSYTKLVPSKNEFKKMNQVQPGADPHGGA